MKKSMIVMIMLMMVLSLSLFGENSFDKTMNKITVEYLKIKDALTNDRTTNVQKNAETILKLAKKLDASNLTGEHKDHFQKIPKNITVAAKELSETKKIKAMRKAFNDLSKPMAMWATMMKPSGINVAYCPMYKASWLQTGKEIRNPYYGASMLKCGEIVSVGAELKEEHVCINQCNHDEMKKNCDHNMKMMDGNKCEENCDHKGMRKDHVSDDKCDHNMKMMKDHK